MASLPVVSLQSRQGGKFRFRTRSKGARVPGSDSWQSVQTWVVCQLETPEMFCMMNGQDPALALLAPQNHFLDQGYVAIFSPVDESETKKTMRQI